MVLIVEWNKMVNKYQFSFKDILGVHYYLIDTNIEIVFDEQLNSEGDASIHKYLNKDIKCAKIINGTDKGMLVFYNAKQATAFYEGISLLPRNCALAYYQPTENKS